MTYEDIYNKFKLVTGINPILIDEYRPCIDTFDVPNISNAIVIWLKNGDRIIYIDNGI